MKAATLLIDLHYLPCIDYFACLLPYETIYIEAQGHYTKQSYHNRCYLLTSQKVDRLSVPVIRGCKKQSYLSVSIDGRQPWATHHWRAICTAYGKAPYFEYLATYFQQIFEQGYTDLFAFNWAILQLCLDILGIKKVIKMTDRYLATPDEHTFDARSTIQPSNRSHQPIYHRPFYYQQVFGTDFSPNLSIIDLLFCEGPHAYQLLRKHSIGIA